MTIYRPEARYMRVYSAGSHYLIINGRRIDMPSGTSWFDLDEFSDDIQIDSDADVDFTSIKPLLISTPPIVEWSSGVNYKIGTICLYGNNALICIGDHVSSYSTINTYWRILGVEPGTIIMMPSSNIQGYLPCDGNYTIGSSGSGASCPGFVYWLLFVGLGGNWTQWQAGTTLTVPDLRGLFPAFGGTSAIHNLYGSTKQSKSYGYQNQKMQDHDHPVLRYTGGSGGNAYMVNFTGSLVNMYAGSASFYLDVNAVGAIKRPSLNAAVSVGEEGHPCYYGLYPYIKY